MPEPLDDTTFRSRFSCSPSSVLCRQENVTGQTFFLIFTKSILKQVVLQPKGPESISRPAH